MGDGTLNTETNKNHDQTERKIDLQKIFELSRKNVEKKVKNEFENVTYTGENAGNSFTVDAVKAEIREDENII